MALPERTIEVKQLPEQLSGKQGQIFLRQMRSFMNVDRPRVVLDCSAARQLDGFVLHILLCCLEEAMKRNGDVRLAALPAGARAVLEITGAERLFETYATVADAVNSFHQFPEVAASGQRQTNREPEPVPLRERAA